MNMFGHFAKTSFLLIKYSLRIFHILRPIILKFEIIFHFSLLFSIWPQIYCHWNSTIFATRLKNSRISGFWRFSGTFIWFCSTRIELNIWQMFEPLSGVWAPVLHHFSLYIFDIQLLTAKGLLIWRSNRLLSPDVFNKQWNGKVLIIKTFKVSLHSIKFV